MCNTAAATAQSIQTLPLLQCFSASCKHIQLQSESSEPEALLLKLLCDCSVVDLAMVALDTLSAGILPSQGHAVLWANIAGKGAC